MRKFTLIELLVVVAIIGLLVTILLPSLSKAGEKAREAVCLSNERQIGIAFHTYASANNNYLPHGYTSSSKYSWTNFRVHGSIMLSKLLTPIASD